MKNEKISVLLILLSYFILIESSEHKCSEHQYGALRPDSNDCSKYYRCETQIDSDEFYWINEFCPPYEYFNWTISNCISNYGSCNDALIAPYTHCKNGESQDDPSDIKQYFVCRDGTWTSKICSGKSIYDETINECSTRTSNFKEYEKRCVEDSLKIDSNDCSKYYICDRNSEWISMSCKSGMYFSNGKKKCIYDDNNMCDKIKSYNRVEIPQETTTIANSIHTEQCIEMSIKPDIKDCSRYFLCENGAWLLRACSNNEYFDIFFLECRIDFDNNCNHYNGFEDEIVDQKPFKTKLCENFDTKPNENNCMEYYRCSNNEWILTTCKKNMYYNKDEKKCIWDDDGYCNDQNNDIHEKVIKSYENCKEGETKSDKFDCGHYYSCSNNKWISKECDYSTYYSQTKKRCVFNDGSCARNDIETNFRTTTKIVSKQSCSTGDSKPDSFDCIRYYVCKNKKWIPAQCPRNMHYNENQKKCIPGSCNENDENNINESHEIDNCRDGQTKSDTLNCGQYYLCKNNIWIKQECGPKMYYNNNKQKCIRNDGSCSKNGNDKKETKFAECSEGKFRINRNGGSRSSKAYYECYNGQWVLRNCNNNQIFNVAKQKCEKNILNMNDYGNDDDNDDYYPCEEGVHKANNGNKLTFYVCGQGKWILKSCPDGFIFDANSTICLPDMNTRKAEVKTK